MKNWIVILSTAVALNSGGTRLCAAGMLSNLDQYPSDGLGDVLSPCPGISFGTLFSTGAGFYTLDAVTVEHYLFEPASPMQLQLFRADLRQGSETPQFSLVTLLGSPKSLPEATRDPGQSTFVAYFPGSPVTLEPFSSYLVAVGQTPEGTLDASVVSTMSPLFSGAEGWKLGLDYIGFRANDTDFWFQWDYGHLKFQVDATPTQPANNPPDVSAARASVSTLWPVNGKFVPFHILDVTDPDGDPVSIAITHIEQDEPVHLSGNGRKGPDAVITDEGGAVRAERLGKSNGRVYKVSFTATDGKPGGSTDGVVYILVPKDMGNALIAIDDGPTNGYFNSTE